MCVLLTGHSVTESSTRVRKDGDDVQQDLSGVVHDFMEPTLLAIPAHLKIDVSFLDALVISSPPTRFVIFQVFYSSLPRQFHVTSKPHSPEAKNIAVCVSILTVN